MTPYDKMIAIREAMLDDYKKGNLPDCFKCYFNWKLGLCELSDITAEEANKMIESASQLLETYYERHPNPFENLSIYIDDNVWQNYEGFKEDKYIVSYLEIIDSELSSLAIGNFFS